MPGSALDPIEWGELRADVGNLKVTVEKMDTKLDNALKLSVDMAKIETELHAVKAAHRTEVQSQRFWISMCMAGLAVVASVAAALLLVHGI